MSVAIVAVEPEKNIFISTMYLNIIAILITVI